MNISFSYLQESRILELMTQNAHTPVKMCVCVHTDITQNWHKEEKFKAVYLPVFSTVVAFTCLTTFSSMIGKKLTQVDILNASVQNSGTFQPWYFVFSLK